MIETLLLKIAPWLAGLAVAVLGYFAGRSAGKDNARADQAEKILKGEGKLREADKKVAEMGDADARNRLADWVRNDD